MRVAGIACLVLMSGFALPLCAQTPSLADVAEREKARRAALTESSRVYANDDLRGGLRLTTGRATPDLEPDTLLPPDEPPPALDSETPPRDEASWRDRITSAREDRRRAELMAAALQNRIDGLWSAFTSRDDPVQRSQIERDRNDALQELQRTEDEVDCLDQEIRDIQEEARQSGVPPGWLR